MFNFCWRDDEGNLQSIAHTANVLTGSGWQTITRETDESEAEFRLRKRSFGYGRMHWRATWRPEALGCWQRYGLNMQHIIRLDPSSFGGHPRS
jgi:hypothetical protein